MHWPCCLQKPPSREPACPAYASFTLPTPPPLRQALTFSSPDLQQRHAKAGSAGHKIVKFFLIIQRVKKKHDCAGHMQRGVTGKSGTGNLQVLPRNGEGVQGNSYIPGARGRGREECVQACPEGGPVSKAPSGSSAVTCNLLL